LALGRLIPDYFPHIFGHNERQPLDQDATLAAFQNLSSDIDGSLSIDEIAYGFIRVANEAMCRPIRELTQAKGYDTKKHILACFGGAGGQHACAIARTLGITRIFIHRHSSVLSAFGLSLADEVVDKQEPSALVFQSDTFPELRARLERLEKYGSETLQYRGYSVDQIVVERYLNLRYRGTDCAFMTPVASVNESVVTAFIESYTTQFGFALSGRDLIVDDVRVRAIGRQSRHSVTKPIWSSDGSALVNPSQIASTHSVYFEGGRRETPVYRLESLNPFNVIQGPAIILDANSTILVEPFCEALVTQDKSVAITIRSLPRSLSGIDLDPVLLSIFSHRFMSIAEQVNPYFHLRLYDLLSDGKNSAANVDFDKHQRTLGLFVCTIWTRRRPGCKCTSHTGIYL
jgi:5-oxoprolinase (ATP-hydrolysing)